MHRFNLAAPEFSVDANDPPEYRAGLFRPGKGFGAERTGTSLYDLPPGVTLCPYHYEVGEEERLLVLSGEATVRTPEGEVVLGPLDGMFFPTGPEGAHGVRNAGSAPARVLMWSDRVVPTATIYPDSGKVGVWIGDDQPADGTYRIADAVEYYDGER